MPGLTGCPIWIRHLLAMADQDSALPSNLLPQALRDLVLILRSSARAFGPIVARRSLARLTRRCRAIAEGTEAGHIRHDVSADRPVRFINEPPWVIMFDPRTRLVIRILHQHRDIATIMRRH